MGLTGAISQPIPGDGPGVIDALDRAKLPGVATSPQEQAAPGNGIPRRDGLQAIRLVEWKGAMVATRRGFFGAILHQRQVAERQRQREANAAHRARLIAARQAEQAHKQAQRGRSQAAKASAAEQKAAEREAQRLHEEAMQADVAARNAELTDTYGEIDSMLAATLGVDDFVDMEAFRKVSEDPPFPRGDLLQPAPQPAPLVARAEPRYVEPERNTGLLGGLFGGKKKHAELVAQAQAVFAADHAAWQAEVAQLPAAKRRQQQEYEEAEQQRQAQLQAARARHDTECRQRALKVEEENRELDTLIQGLAYGVEEAIQEYVSIVLRNSAYPDSFPVEHEFTFDSSLKELILTVLVPAPEGIPTAKEYKYVRAKDEIVATALSQKDQKDRYANAVAQVALRTLHEIFESDRAGRIQTINLTVASEAISAATGLMTRAPLVAVATDRATFTTIDLSNVVPTATLKHLGALVSKNPLGLVAIDMSKGVRGR